MMSPRLHSPQVSIGLPVFNGEAYLEEALESLISQTYRDFEIIISDNASTDGTEEICRAYALKDERVSYFRNRINYGYVHNFNNVFRLSSGKYFKWAASDDVCAEDFLLRCKEVLDRDRSAVLAYTGIAGIDDTGSGVSLPAHYHRQGSLYRSGGGEDPIESADPVQRFRRLMRNPWWVASCFFGLIRAEVLERTMLHFRVHGGDHILLTELSLHGRFREIPEELLFIRIHTGKLSRVRTRRERIATQGTPAVGQEHLPWWKVLHADPVRRVQGYLAVIKRGSFNRKQRLLGYAEVVRALVWWMRVRGIPGLLRMVFPFSEKQKPLSG